jgi:hypothetical protein
MLNKPSLRTDTTFDDVAQLGDLGLLPLRFGHSLGPRSCFLGRSRPLLIPWSLARDFYAKC